MKLRCNGCDIVSPEFANTASVGVMADATTYRPVYTHDTGLLWLCQPCYKQCRALAKEILKIVKDEQFYFPNLLK